MNDIADTPSELGERFFRELADNAPVMIWTSGPQALCNWFNKPWLDFVGRTMDQELGNGWAENVHKDDVDRCLKIYCTALKAREPFTMVYRLRRGDGVYREVLDNGKPFFRGGVFAGYLGSCIDVTEQRALEAQLRHAQKMEAIGQITGGVAHDFNNLLQVIASSLELLVGEVGDDERARRRLRNALKAVSRGAKLTSQLLAFARHQPLAPKVINPERLLADADDMLRRTLGETIAVETVVANGLWNTLADPVQLENALLNLAVNGRDAMKGRGTLTIEAANATLDADYAAGHHEVAPGEYVLLSVTDTGGGIPPEHLAKVFDPFFTTKPEGQGTGLGLSMVHGFVRQSKGHIEIESTVGRGSTVRIYLPRARQLEDAPTELKAVRAAGGAETILLVEDDAGVREATADMLSDLGYQILEAGNPDIAMTMLEGGACIDMLVSDVVMPGVLRPAELAQKVRERNPGTAVLFISGYSGATIPDVGEGERPDLLTKPFTSEQMARKIRSILRKRKAEPKRRRRLDSRTSAPTKEGLPQPGEAHQRDSG